MLQSYHGNDWFFHHVGFKETVESVYKNLKLTQSDGFDEITSLINGKKYRCGKFSLRTVDSFNPQSRNNGKFHIIRGNGAKSSKFELIDVLKMQNLPEFKGATFQAASNFNCLELASHLASPANGVNSYATDLTQGPAISIASFGALMYRNYFVQHDGAIGQTKKDLNLLDSTPIKVVRGKAMIMEEEEFKRLEKFDFENEKNYKIGVHENVQITTNRVNGFTYTDSEPGQFVHQVFCSSFALGDYVKKDERIIPILKNLLKTEYKATILAAHENSLKYPGFLGSNKCVLTALGMGFFCNPPPIVCEAIKSTKEVIKRSGLDVYLVCFADDNKTGFGAVYPHLKDLVAETGGEIISAI